MSRQTLVLVLVILTLPAAGYIGYEELKKRDFNHICRVYEKHGSRRATVDAATLAYEMAVEIESGVFTPQVQKLIEATGMVNPAQKYELYLEAAKQVGHHHWNCPAMRDF